MISIRSLIAGLFVIKVVLGKGCVQLDSISFDKVISKFEASLIKFDIAYPYDAKHTAFEAFCEKSFIAKDLLAGEVQVKDYGDKTNMDLMKRYGLTQENFPVVKLFLKGRDEPIEFVTQDDKDFTEENMLRFVRANSNVYFGLSGCLQEFDEIAGKFIKTKCPEQRKKLIESAELSVKSLKENEKKSAETYVKLMKKIQEKGDEFISNEKERIGKILKAKTSNDKKAEMHVKMNILHSFISHDEL